MEHLQHILQFDLEKKPQFKFFYFLFSRTIVSPGGLNVLLATFPSVSLTAG